jgi:hypothetical protein
MDVSGVAAAPVTFESVVDRQEQSEFLIMN